MGSHHARHNATTSEASRHPGFVPAGRAPRHPGLGRGALLRYAAPVRTSIVLRASLACALLVSCGDDDDTHGFVFADASADGSGMAGRDSAIPPAGECPPGTEWIYLIDFDKSFIRFQPDTRALAVIGTLDCPGVGDATPFSMGIGRDAYARVLYNDGRIFRVSLNDLSCTATDFATGQMGFELFGMGYSADSLGSSDETLYIGGGPVLTSGPGAPAMLGSIDAALVVQSHGMLSSLPELTGTANGDLWGFFPGETPMVVREIAKTDGHTLQMFDVAMIAAGTSTQSYAFAFWGGRFYIFYKGEESESSSVWALTTDLGTLEQIIPSTGHRIVGAGVSTCAPSQLI